MNDTVRCTDFKIIVKRVNLKKSYDALLERCSELGFYKAFGRICQQDFFKRQSNDKMKGKVLRVMLS